MIEKDYDFMIKNYDITKTLNFLGAKYKDFS